MPWLALAFPNPAHFVGQYERTRVNKRIASACRHSAIFLILAGCLCSIGRGMAQTVAAFVAVEDGGTTAIHSLDGINWSTTASVFLAVEGGFLIDEMWCFA